MSRLSKMTNFQPFSAIPANISKEWISLSYLQAICAQAGLNIKGWKWDNGIDLEIGSSRPAGKNQIANASIALQLKATANWAVEQSGKIKFSLPMKNYRQLIINNSVCPQYLVLFTMPSDQAAWVQYSYQHTDHKHVIEVRHMAYYMNLSGFPVVKNKKNVQVEIPAANELTAQTLINLYNAYIQNLSVWMTNQIGN